MRIWAFPSFYPIEYPGMKSNGIFAHRQYKGLIEHGAELKVIQPVLWYPPKPFLLLNKNWKKLSEVNYPLTRNYDGIEVNHPRIANCKPSRIFNKQYAERYCDAIVNFFTHNKIILTPATDIFYSQWIPTSRYVQAAAKKLNTKSAVLAIGDDVMVWPHANIENMNSFGETWADADYRIAVADYIAREANKLTNKPLPSFVVRRGVEHDQFVPVSVSEKQKIRTELNIPRHKLLILSVGSSIARKGWLELFDALALLRTTNPDILLAGIHSGPVDIDLNEEARKRSVTDLFLNLGEVPPKIMSRYYSAADVFCLPSHWEGIANAVVEAMSCGLPVLTTDVCGHPELITSGVNGILIPPKNPELLLKALASLINDKEQRETLGQNAREFIVNEWGSFSQNALKLYKILSS